MTTVLVVAGVILLILVLLALVVPRLVRRGDERRAGSATGLGEPIPGFQEATVVTDDGATLQVVERGEGTPILLVHGLSLDHRLWHYQYLDLADRYRLVGVDIRGHGRSTLGSEPIGPHRLASDLAAVLQQRDLRGAVVVGHSLGGTVVGQLCADHPDLVRERIAGLVFVGTFASSVAGEGRFREVVSPTMIRLTAKLRAGSKPKERPSSGAVAYAMARTPFGPRPQPEQVRFTIGLGSAIAPAVMTGATVANLAYDVREQLRGIDLPSLVIRGTHDSLATARSVEQLERALAHPEVVLFPDSGHLPMLESRERFAEVVTGFAERVTTAP